MRLIGISVSLLTVQLWILWMNVGICEFLWTINQGTNHFAQNANLTILYSNRHILSQRIKKLFCESLVLSRLNYCDCNYVPELDCVDRKNIQRIRTQNFCLSFIHGTRGMKGFLIIKYIKVH